jgi:hypothetical protein
MVWLTNEELECLRRIDCCKPCSSALLARLEQKGLIERNPLVIMPQLPQGFGRGGYRLTPEGRAALSGRGVD